MRGQFASKVYTVGGGGRSGWEMTHARDQHQDDGEPTWQSQSREQAARPLEQEETHSTWPWATVPGQGIRTNLLSQSLQQSSKHISLWSTDGAQCAQCLPATHKALLLTHSTQ